MWKRKPGVRSLSEIFQRQFDFQMLERNVQPDVHVLEKLNFSYIFNHKQSGLHNFRVFCYMRIKLSTDPTYTEFLLVH